MSDDARAIVRAKEVASDFVFELFFFLYVVVAGWVGGDHVGWESVMRR
jgi:hypothetical protein